jgi:hypothetical protein
VTVYLVLDDFGRLGRSYRETDEAKADVETVISNMLAGDYSKPVRVVEFNMMVARLFRGYRVGSARARQKAGLAASRRYA